MDVSPNTLWRMKSWEPNPKPAQRAPDKDFLSAITIDALYLCMRSKFSSVLIIGVLQSRTNNAAITHAATSRKAAFRVLEMNRGL